MKQHSAESIRQVRVDQLEIDQLVDLELDPYADPGDKRDSRFQWEYGRVLDIVRETPNCIVVEFQSATIAFPPEHIVNVIVP